MTPDDRRPAMLRDLTEWADTGVVAGYRTIAPTSACARCQRMAAQRYRLADPLPLPHTECTCVGGCRCSIVAILDSEW